MHALVRHISSSLAACELSHIDRSPPDVPLARIQHANYVEALKRLGCTVEELPALDAHPDAVFVEDTAVVVDEVAVSTRPGAASRQGEVESMAAALAAHRPVVRLTEPATLDGGDVLVAGKNVFVGVSARSNAAGRAQLDAALRPFGYRVIPVETRGCLHLKSAVTAVTGNVLLIQRDWLVDPAIFARFDTIDVDAEEPHAANVVSVNDVALMPASFPRTAERLRARGHAVATVDLSELQKAEGATTCCSILLR